MAARPETARPLGFLSPRPWRARCPFLPHLARHARQLSALRESFPGVQHRDDAGRRDRGALPVWGGGTVAGCCLRFPPSSTMGRSAWQTLSVGVFAQTACGAAICAQTSTGCASRLTFPRASSRAVGRTRRASNPGSSSATSLRRSCGGCGCRGESTTSRSTSQPCDQHEHPAPAASSDTTLIRLDRSW